MTNERLNGEARGVQSIEVGMNILLPFLGSSGPLKLREIADQAGVSQAQAHAYLVSFRRMNLVEQDSETGRYRLGPYALQLAIDRMRMFDPMRAAMNVASDLCTQTGLTVAVSIWGSFGPTVVLMLNGIDQVYINTSVGSVYSVSGTATGMVFAAFMPDEAIKSAIQAELREAGKTPRVGRTRKYAEIAAELDRIRACGYATIQPNPVPGIKAIAAPVWDHAGQIQMTMAVIGTEQTHRFDDGSPLVTQLLDAAAKLSFEHGHAGGS